MKTNKLDKNIKEKLEQRTFQPSISAWERLSEKLEEQTEEKKKGWFFYMGYVASITLLISVAVVYFGKKEVINPEEIIVDVPLDTVSIKKNIDVIFNEITKEEAIVENSKTEVKQPSKNTPKAKKYYRNTEVIESKNVQNKKNLIVEIENFKENIPQEKEENKSLKREIKILKQNPNSRIRVNSDDLLYAVTHSPEEVKTYYAKYNIDREDVLNTIKNELQKSNINVNPTDILAEVERSINEDDYQNNFMKILKEKVSDITTAIAGRNH